MGGMNGWGVIGQRFLAALLIAWIGLGLISCGNLTTSPPPLSPENAKPSRLASQLAEAAPPKAIQELRQVLEPYQPQVKILSPRANQVFQNEPVTVRFQVRDLPIFQDPEWGLGPHLNVFLDDQPYQAIYDPEQTLVFSNLSPGSHTIRAFAARPWDESFKNEGAYAQTTFHILTRTVKNNPVSDQPLLTYGSPQAVYGTEPILLDFFLTNAPLHMIAQADPEDDTPDWRIRCTINGVHFVFDQWQPIYLKGFKSGTNWIQLELIDEKGNLIPNVFNDPVRLIEYEPNGTDTLSQIIRGELAIADILGIVDPDYEPPQPEPQPAESEPEAAPEEFVPISAPEPEPTPISEPKAEKSPPSSRPELEPEPIAVPEPEAAASESELSAPEPEPESVIEPAPVITPESPAETAAPKTVDQTEAAPLESDSKPAKAPETEAEVTLQLEPTVEELESQTELQPLFEETAVEETANSEEEREPQLEPPVAEPEVESVAPEPSQPVESTFPAADEATAEPLSNVTETLNNVYNRAQTLFQIGVQQVRDRLPKSDLIPSKTPAALESEEPADLSPLETPEAPSSASDTEPSATLDEAADIAP